MKLDKVDFKILWNLENNARIPLSQLAKIVNLSKQTLSYRLKKLINEKIILGFTTLVDIHKLGHLTYRIYFRFKSVDEKKEKEIIEYFKNHDYAVWVVNTSGSWDFQVVFTARNFIHFNNMFKKIKEDLGNYFSKYNASSSVFNYHFRRDYLLNKKREDFTPRYYGFEPKQEYLDETNIDILIELSRNCRQSNQEIGKKLGITYHTVNHRIKKMTETKIIQYHRAHLNIPKIGYRFYKANIVLNHPTKEQEKSLYLFCSHFNSVVYLVEVLGEWQFEIEAETKNQEEFEELLKKVRNKFPDLILDYDILQVTKEHKLNYFPMGRKIQNK